MSRRRTRVRLKKCEWCEARDIADEAHRKYCKICARKVLKLRQQLRMEYNVKIRTLHNKTMKKLLQIVKRHMR